MDTVENNFTLKHGQSISQYNIFSNMISTCYKENFKLVKTLVFLFVCSEMPQWQQINWSHSLYQKSFSSTKLTDNVTSSEKRHPAIWMKWIFKTDSTHYHLYGLKKLWMSYYLKIYNGYINVVK